MTVALDYRINLTTTDSVTAPIFVPAGAAKISVDINDDSATYTWGSAVVALQYSLANEIRDTVNLENWNAFSPAVTFTTSTTSRRNIRVSGTGWIRLKVTTADSGADINAVATVWTNWNA